LEHETAKLMTEAANPRTANLDSMAIGELLQVMNDEDKKVALAVENELPQIEKAVKATVYAFGRGGRLVYIGAGTSGRLGVLDAAECPPTFGVDPNLVLGLIAGGETALLQAVEGAEDDAALAVSELEKIEFSADDVLVGIAASGRTPYVLGGLRYAEAQGAVTVAISCSPNSAISKIANIPITLLVGPEVVTGSTRLKAGTATKMVLNMLTTAAMVRIGKVYGNLMVDVKTSNHKLIERARRIVAQAAGVDDEQAAVALEKAGMNAKVAIVMIKRNCSAEEAEELLKAADGFIRKALSNNRRGISL